MNKKVEFPTTAQFPEGMNYVDCAGIIVVVGANGSGKTRLGVWLENSQPNETHRVSAQKSLEFPQTIRPMDLQMAEHILRVGDEHGDVTGRRKDVRWQGRPETILLNDYEKLVQYLFSEEHDQSMKYRVSMKATNTHQAPPETKLDAVKRIWEQTLPQRELILSGGKVEAKNRRGLTLYHAMHMSDGERVAFYLIGEALSVPPGGIFIVDEPELHLHRAVQARLWDAIEAERPDCVFVYLTHDLDFAASREGAAKIWLREYTDGKWEWDRVPDDPSLPEPMLLELLGSRKPILFVEGDKGSLDYFVYRKLFFDWNIVPAGNCSQVIQATSSFTALAHLHSNTCCGIVDTDSRTDADASLLDSRGVKVLPFSEIENLFLIEPVLEIAAEVLSLDKQATVAAVQDRVFSALSHDRERVVSLLTATELETGFHNFDAKAQGRNALELAFNNVARQTDPGSIYDNWDLRIGNIISSRNYRDALRFYSNKGLSAVVAPVFKTPLRELILRKLRSGDSQSLIATMKAAMPCL